jgi:AcrR family transcriptional regulator
METPRERRSERTRQTILDTALALIIEKGLNKLSLREIARRVDYSPAGLYEYFGSKDEIVEAVIRDASERFFAHLNRVSKTLPVEGYLTELGMAYIEFAQLNPDHFMLMFTHHQAMPDIDLESYAPDAENDSYGLLMHGVQRALDEGLIKGRKGYGKVEITYSLWSLVHGMAMLQATYLRPVKWDFITTDRHALARFIEGLKQV